MVSEDFNESWGRIEKWLLHNAPGIHESLNQPASNEEIQRLEDYYQVNLPADLGALYRLHNGQDDTGPGIVNFIFGFNFMPIDYALGFHDGAFSDIELIEFEKFKNIHRHVNPVRESPLHFHPILEGHVRYALCSDFRPNKGGVLGQLIYYDVESEVACKISGSVTEMLRLFAHDLESGLYTVSDEEPRWLETAKEVDLSNWSYNGMDKLYPDGRNT